MARKVHYDDKCPDPGYTSPGYIDVLYMTDEHDLSLQADNKKYTKLRPTNATTPGYCSDLYDTERWISIHESVGLNQQQGKDSDSECMCSGSTSRKRKRENDQSIEPTEQHHTAWRAFKYYLENSIPLKISDVSSFRHPENQNASISSGVLPCSVESLPASVLDKTITVQCAFPSNGSGECKSPQQLDRDISLCRKDAKSCCATFMGQENQITTEMTLREATSFKGCQVKGVTGGDEHSPSMAVCVAQEPILTVSSSEKSKQQLDSDICIQNDGRVSIRQKHNTSEVLPPLNQLAELLRLPSYFLLGNQDLLDNKSQISSVTIQDINLWHAPQNCASNVHYDDRDNFLMVTEGVKTVELCPPGCIEASPIYSEHANHPAFLTRRCISVPHGQHTRDILENKRDRTHLVSISAGQALFIPAGWWHRVESTGTCTAVNVWFEHDLDCQVETPRHMAAFRLRQRRRKYYESNETQLATNYLQQLRRDWARKNDIVALCDSLENTAISYARDRRLLTELTTSSERLEDQTMTSFIKVYIKCWDKFTNASCTELDIKYSRDEMKLITYFGEVMNEFLLQVRLGRVHQLQSVVNMWPLFPKREQPKAVLFERLVHKLKPAACYVITQAWEKHASGVRTTTSEAHKNCQEEVERSYKHFFSMFDDEYAEQTIRTFLLDGVETFREAIFINIKWPKDL